MHNQDTNHDVCGESPVYDPSNHSSSPFLWFFTILWEGQLQCQTLKCSASEQAAVFDALGVRMCWKKQQKPHILYKCDGSVAMMVLEFAAVWEASWDTITCRQ